MLETTAPILPARSFDETADFYQKIGFRETGRWNDMQYLIMVMDKVEMHFFGHAELDPANNHSAAYIRTSDVDGLNAHLESLGLPDEGMPRFHPVEDKPWEMRELAVIDPNGNLLRVGQFL